MSYRFDPFLLNPATRELREQGELVALPARAFDCLAYLVEHRERAVGRDELIAAVWGRAEVSDALLSHTIVKLRRSLGDTGNEQRTIRTVPRFGYRWIGEIETVDSASADAPVVERPEPEPEPESEADAQAQAPEPSAAMSAASVAPLRRMPRWLLPAIALLCVLALLFAGLARRAPSQAVAPLPAPAHDDALTEASAAPALVLPAEVDAPDDWRWLRLGLMDLVATRLRDGALPTLSSESVVGLLRQRDAAVADALHDPVLVQAATLRVQPRVRRDGERWIVRLDAAGSQRSLSVEATAPDAIAAAREAADLLLRKLGHAPGTVAADAPSPALDELLQRSGAAMLADQLEQARDLIQAAAPELQQAPRIEQRMAQIELRAGDYPAVERRLQALLDRLAPQRDPALRARALITLAAAHVRQNQPERAAELYEEAITLRKDAADHEALGVAYLGRGVVLAQTGRLDEATAELSRARIELETVGDGLGIASVDVNLGDFRLQRHQPAAALPIFLNAAQAFSRLGAREGLAHALAQQAGAQRELLDVDAALATTTRFWPAEAHTSNLRMRWRLTAVRAVALADSGRRVEAQVLIARILAESDPRGDAGTRAQAHALVAELAWRRGDATATAVATRDALVPALRDVEPALYTRMQALQGHALLRDGRTQEAAVVSQALRAAAAGDAWAGMYASLAEAAQAEAGGRRGAALEQYAAALQAAERFDVPEDLVAVSAPFVRALVEASQLDTARTVAGRIARWADRDLRAAIAQSQLFHALGEDDAARKADEVVARLSGA